MAKVTFEQGSKVREGGSSAHRWEKKIPDWGNSKCKGPEVSACLVCRRNSKEPLVAEVE